MHQVIRITEDINNKLNVSTPTAAVFLDIEKAFDKGWHDGLIYKMAEHRLPNWTIRLIKSYLSNRTFKVKIQDTLSTPKPAAAGVPQGSVLGPLLYNLYTADIPQPPQCKLAQFADDTALYTHGRIQSAIVRKLTTDLKIITNWFTRWKIKINKTKTTAIYFSNKNKIPPDKIKINNTKIPWTKEAKYSNIVLFDNKLNFGKHIAKTEEKAKQLTWRIYPLIHGKSKMSLENKLRLVKSVFIPSLLYGCEAWVIANPNQKIKIERKVNKMIRIATNAPWYISNQQIRKELGLEKLEDTIKKRCIKTLEKMEEHEDKLIKEITMAINPRNTDKRRGIINSIRLLI